MERCADCQREVSEYGHRAYSEAPDTPLRDYGPVCDECAPKTCGCASCHETEVPVAPV